MNRVLVLAVAAALQGMTHAQQIVSVGNLRHVVTNLDQSVTLYRDVFGLLVATPTGPFEANPARQILEDTPGAQSRRVALPIPGLRNSLELVEYSGVNQQRVFARIQDPGAGILHLGLPNLQQVLLRSTRSGAREITGVTGFGQSRLLQDQDGFIVRLTQVQTQVTTSLVYPVEPPSRPDNVPPLAAGPEAGFQFTVENLQKTLDAYRALGLRVSLEPAVTMEGQVTIGRSTVTFLEFPATDRKALHTRPQDPGTSILQLNVRELDALLTRLNAAGFAIVTSGGRPVELNSTRAVLVRDPNNLYLELMELPGLL